VLISGSTVRFGAHDGRDASGSDCDSSDEFYRSRVNVGTRFVMGGIGLYLFAAWLMNIFDLAHSAGYVLASGESAADTGLVGLFWTDALTLASVLSVLFYAGYTFACDPGNNEVEPWERSKHALPSPINCVIAPISGS
jgi:hypothetical protein